VDYVHFGLDEQYQVFLGCLFVAKIFDKVCQVLSVGSIELGNFLLVFLDHGSAASI
jgi:hypothetical protein